MRRIPKSLMGLLSAVLGGTALLQAATQPNLHVQETSINREVKTATSFAPSLLDRPWANCLTSSVVANNS